MSDDGRVAFEGSHITLGVLAGDCVELLIVGTWGYAEGGNGSHARAFRTYAEVLALPRVLLKPSRSR